jgi:hypothetical protein
MTDNAVDARPAERARDAARDVVHTLTEATSRVEAQLSTAADAAGTGVHATSEVLRRRSDPTLAMLGTFSAGLTTGLLVGGAHRLLTVASLVPTAIIGGVILERVDRPRRRPHPDHAEDPPPR